MCNCGNKVSTTVTPTVRRTVAKESVTDECPYTIDQINTWLTRVSCVQSNGLYAQIPNITKKQVNIYVGVLLSARNNSENICAFQRELTEVESFITVLIYQGICNS
jgi:hypothetical protein